MRSSPLLLLPLLAACALGGPKSAEDCLPTLGDHCSCEPKCMTRAEIDEAQRDGVCDLGCDTASEALDWECGLSGADCVVLE